MCALLVVFVGSVFSQDLQKQKQDKIQRINAIDKELNAGGVSKEDYDRLIDERKKAEAAIRDIDKKLMADVDAMKKINAVKKAFNDALTSYKLGQYQQAISHSDNAVSLDPNFAQAYYVKGLSLNKLRQYAEAAAAYEGAVQHNPNYAEAYVALGKIYSARMRQPDKAIATYDAAIENNPSAPKVYYELGAVYQNHKKDYKKAVKNFMKATQIKPDYDLAFFSLGVSQTELSQFDQAIANLENALAFTTRKKWASPHARLAVVFNKKGNCQKAVEESMKALEVDKKNALANYEAGKAAKCLGQLQKALAYFEALKKDRRWKRTAEYEIDLIVNRDKYGGSN
jgi:tetratricopeptide (TPR) repeat protein